MKISRALPALLLACVAATIASILLLGISRTPTVTLVDSEHAHQRSISQFDGQIRAAIGSPAVQEAAVYAFMRINADRESCNLAPYKEFQVWSAKAQLTDGVSYVLEMQMLPEGKTAADVADGTPFTVDVEKLLPPAFHPVHTSENNGKTSSFFAHHQMRMLSPSPCMVDLPPAALSAEDQGNEMMEQTAHLINADPASSWEATVYPEFATMTKNAFRTTKLGFTPPPKSMLSKKKSSKLATGLQLPKNFDARDKDGDCKAYQVQDQKDCGSCFLFSAASAFSQRLCQYSNRRFDINLSPQDILSCYSANACSEGGMPLLVYEHMTTEGKVSDWCSPYEARDPSMGAVCGDVCQEGIRFHVENGTLGWIADSAEDIIEELVFNGPVVLGFLVHSDFPHYKSGVYKVSPAAQKNILGGHAVVAVGYGTTEEGEDYWLCANSWSKNWGENGFFRIARGRNEARIEEFGAFFARPQIPSICPSVSSCAHGGELLQNCGCRCMESWTGERCEKCGLACKMGEVEEQSCTCRCFPGYEGKQCEDLLTIKRAFTCSSSPPLFQWELHSRRISVGSYVQVFPFGSDVWNETTNQWATPASLPLPLCGTKDTWSVENRWCKDEGAITLVNLPVGSYEVYLVEFLGKNEFGVPRGYKRPQRLSPSVRIAPSCGDVTAIKFRHAEEKLQKWHQQEVAEEKRLETQIARLREALSYTHSHPAPRLHSEVKAFPAVAFHQAHFYVHVPQGEAGYLRVCPQDTTTIDFFRQTMAVAEPACVDVSPPTRDGEATALDSDIVSVPTDRLPSGKAVVELLINGRVVSASTLTVAHVQLTVTGTTKIAGGGGLRVWITWKVSPPTAATDKDWVGIYADDSSSHVAGFYTAGPEVANAPSRAEGSAEMVLRMGEYGARPGLTYTAVFMPAGSTSPAAADVFLWE